ncbi:hypothetical protein [Nocardiopsis flavescens]|uniref:hypothetical protein n=1 Tax=Nocardiopsis flavescens TaxID=758803 RepID=UPI00116109BE|nr:hypothetical protein [Nocardiopsis flavescens]
MFENGFAGSRALCRYLALQARDHGAAAYPGLPVVSDRAAGRRLLVSLEQAAPTAAEPVFVVVDDPRALQPTSPPAASPSRPWRGCSPAAPTTCTSCCAATARRRPGH